MREYPANRCVHQLFEDQVAADPGSRSRVFEDQQLTYGELDARSNQLAHRLRTMSVGPEMMVGICLERSLEMVVGMLGHPQGGRRLSAAGSRISDGTPGLYARRLPCPDSARSAAPSPTVVRANHPAYHRLTIMRRISPVKALKTFLARRWTTSLAYVIYTSGSTGRPKGAMNTHRGDSAIAYSGCRTTYRLATTDRCFRRLRSVSTSRSGSFSGRS